jgi:membrane protease YdiL (CAAX protease family)
MTPAPAPEDRLNLAIHVVVRVGVFALLAWLGMLLFPWLMFPLAGLLVTSALGTFAAAAVANAVSVRAFEHGALADMGLAWTPQSGRELLAGAGMGAVAGILMLSLPLALGLARFAPSQPAERPWAAFAFVSVTLLFGAVGEEMLFHGYAFQLLVRKLGTFATILPAGVLFGLAHIGNQNATLLGIVNTMAWGILLGYAFVRTGALWLPIGLHFGWNFTLPLFGVNLSGFTMGVTGYALEWHAGVLWSGGGYGPEGSLPTTLVVMALPFALHRWIRPAGEETRDV